MLGSPEAFGKFQAVSDTGEVAEAGMKEEGPEDAEELEEAEEVKELDGQPRAFRKHVGSKKGLALANNYDGHKIPEKAVTSGSSNSGRAIEVGRRTCKNKVPTRWNSAVDSGVPPFLSGCLARARDLYAFLMVTRSALY